LHSLLTNRQLYEEESALSRQRAIAFVQSIQPGRMEEYLKSLAPAAESHPAIQAPAAGSHLLELSPEKRALLLARLRKGLGKSAD